MPAPIVNSNADPAQTTAFGVLDQVLQEVEQTTPQAVAQAVPQAVPQAVLQAVPQAPVVGMGTGPAKETFTISPQEMAAASPSVEYEKGAEIPPEVEAYMEQVQQHPEQIPQEIVISGQDVSVMPQRTMSQPVIVLPITPEVEAAGQHQSPKLSIRWLIEWSRRVMKMCSGKVVYREE